MYACMHDVRYTRYRAYQVQSYWYSRMMRLHLVADEICGRITTFTQRQRVGSQASPHNAPKYFLQFRNYLFAYHAK